MSDIPPDLLAEVLREVEEEQGHPDKYTVPIDELLERLMNYSTLCVAKDGVSRGG